VILTSFTVSYTGEQWRAANTEAQVIDFDYSLNASSIEDGAATFVDVNALDFTSLVLDSTGAKDGNTAANRTVIAPVTVSSIAWTPGTDLWIRWRDLNDGGNDHGLAIDDLKFSALPEPGSLLLLVSAVLSLLAYRRLS
jgi:hypothetical protein